MELATQLYVRTAEKKLAAYSQSLTTPMGTWTPATQTTTQEHDMPRYQVYVTGGLEDDFEITADDPSEAFKLAEEQFREDHPGMWSEVNAGSYEIIGGEDETGLDDGF